MKSLYFAKHYKFNLIIDYKSLFHILSIFITDLFIFKVGKQELENIYSELTEIDKNKFLGLNKWLLIGSAVVIAGAIGYKIYNNRK
jgi:hypothetical protein